jgi:hypothetical protein
MTDAPEEELRTEGANPATARSEQGQRSSVWRTVRARFGSWLSPARLWERGVQLWKVVCSLTLAVAGTVAVFVVAILLRQALTQRAIEIEPISVPKQLSDEG